MADFKVYVTDGRHSSYDIERDMLAQIGAELQVCQCATEEDIIRECSDADAILLDMAPMSAKAINALAHCKIINRYGVGYDNVDLNACTAKGIQVTNVPDYCAEDVSDHALALMLACLRDVARRDRLVRQGQWNLQRTSFRLSGKVLGVLGFGRIARALVKRSPIYIFDDSFSALDYKTDATLRSRLKAYTKDSTVFIVAQRISTVLNAEQIIVLDEGKIAGMGTHRQLMESCEEYRQIALSQLSEEEAKR